MSWARALCLLMFIGFGMSTFGSLGMGVEVGTEEQSLSVPAGLEPDVKFWEIVFLKFSPEYCIFHDRDNLNLIYLAKKLDKNLGIPEDRLVKRYIAALRVAFANLVEHGSPSNRLEKRLFEITPHSQRNQEHFRAAMDNIRCQRGIDLKPSFERSRGYVAMVQAILKNRGLPGELAFLPHLESGYNHRAHSRAGARGIWQLMPATARLMGLKVSKAYDERIDPLRATLAASELLASLYRDMGDWPLAITAYNYGANGMARAVKLHGRDYMTVRQKHRSPLFGFAARNYYPSFLAVRNIARPFHKNIPIARSQP